MVFLTANYIYIIIHKCGSRSMLKILKNECAEHNIKILQDGKINNTSIIKQQNINKLFFNNHNYFINYWINNYKIPFSFAVVRNPYSRCISSYNYALRENWFNSSLLNYIKKIKILLNSSIKIENLCNNDKWILHHIIPQYLYITINKTICLDYLLKLENLNNDFNKLKKYININNDISLPHLNTAAAPSTIKNLELTNEIAEEIYKIYETDFKILNYNKNSWNII